MKTRYSQDGYYWTYNSAKAFKKIFPFWSDRKIARMLKELEKDKIIKSGNFNNVSYDRTKWYTIIDKSICQNCQMESPDLSNRFDSGVQPIPYNNHIVKPNKPATKETMSGTELQRYSELKQNLEKNGWVGDFDKLIRSLGSFYVVECYWNNHLSKIIKKVSAHCRGGYISKRFASDAIDFYKQCKQQEQKESTEQENNQLKEEKRKQKQIAIEKAYQLALKQGTEKWQSINLEGKEAIFKKAQKQYDFIDGSFDSSSGEISGKLMQDLIYEQLGSN